MSDDVETRRRRALYRANHRGTKEMDHLMGRYADARVPSMTLAALETFEQFLVLPDPVLQSWFLGSPVLVDTAFSALVADMRSFHGLEPQLRPLSRPLA